MNYRGYEIEKFYSKEMVPKHIIREYYQSEKLRIDRMIKFNETAKNNVNQISVDESLEDFFSLIE